MMFLLLLAAILLLVVSVRSVLGAIRMLRSQAGTPKERRALWSLLALGLLGGGYLSVGLVYASAKVRWYGAPIPMVIFERWGDKWADFVSPFSVIGPIYNLGLWLGLAVAPVTLPAWWRRRGRAWFAELAAASVPRKAASAAAVVLVLVLPPLLGYLTTERHLVTVRNQSAVSLPEIALSVGGTNRYRGAMAPGQERVFDFEQSVAEPYVFSRRDGRDHLELGRCEHTTHRLNRYLVTISGESGDHLECKAVAP
jgi:hypothetical protein